MKTSPQGDISLEGVGKQYVQSMLDDCVEFIINMETEFKIILKMQIFNHLPDTEAKVNCLFELLDTGLKGLISEEDISEAVGAYDSFWSQNDSVLITRIFHFYSEDSGNKGDI